jgi:hypothetical protein
LKPGHALGCAVALALVAGAPATAQVIPFEQRTFNEQVLRPFGQPVVPIFDGWYPKEDGTKRICFGYFNLNTDQSLDVPLGPDNHIEPERFDGLQPTHFDPVPDGNYRRALCVFTVAVPADFDVEDRVTWTLRTNDTELSTPGKVIPPYILDEPESGGRGVVPPVLKLAENGPEFRGRDGYTAPRRTARVGEPMTLRVWVDHPAPRSWIRWTEHQGPEPVEFQNHEQNVPREDGVGTTTVTFREPGEYLLRVQSIYSTASFEYHCCWTNGYVPVTVTR